MNKNQQIISGPALAVVLLGGSYLARKGVAKAWAGVTDKPAPPQQDNQDVELAEAITWAVVSGVTIGVMKFAFRRANFKGSPTD